MSPNETIPHKHCSRKEQCVHPEGSYLPETSEYFEPAPGYRNGLRAQCRVCILDQRRLKNGWKKPHKVMPRARDGFKYCPRCEEEFPATLEYFSPDKQFKSGLASACKKCVAEMSRDWRTRNPDKHLEAKREWRKNNPEKVKQQKSDSQKRNRASANKRASRYTKRHPDRINARTRNRYARKIAAEGTHTDADIAAHYEMQNGLCAYCGIRLFHDYHVDHYIPLIKGGSNWPDNLLLSCMTCNISKNGLLFEEWQERRGW